MCQRTPSAGASACPATDRGIVIVGRRQRGELVGGDPAACHRLISNDPAISKGDEPRGVLGDVGLVCDQEHRDAALRIQPLEDLHDLDARARVEVAGRLVRQDDGGFVDQRPRDRHALLLAAGQLVGKVVGAVAEADGLERRAGAPCRSRRLERAAAVVEQRQLDVVERARARQQVEALEDEADLLVADARQIVARQPRHVAPSRTYWPLDRTVEAPEDVHERGLAGAGRSRDGHELAGLDVERHAAKRADLDFTDDVGLREVPNEYDRHCSLAGRAICGRILLRCAGRRAGVLEASAGSASLRSSVRQAGPSSRPSRARSPVEARRQAARSTCRRRFPVARVPA